MQFTQGQSLLAVLALIYFSDCFYWCRLSGLVFSASRFANWKIVRPGGLLANRKGGLTLLPLLPPLGWSHLVAPRPFILSPMGVCFSSEAGLSDSLDSEEPIPLCDLAQIKARSNELFLGKQKVATCPNKKTATIWADQLTLLAKSEHPNTDIRNMIKAEFNLKELASTQLELYLSIKNLRIANMVLLLLMFVYVPFITWLLGLNSTLILTFIVLFIGAIANSVFFYRAHAKLYPEEKIERIGQTILQLISWPMATRGADLITRNTFATSHPLAVASVILQPEPFQTLAAEWYRRLKYPGHANDAPDSIQRNWQAAALVDIMNETLPTRGWDAPAALHAPEGAEDDFSFCPRCHETYILKEGTCAACVETALLPLPKKKEDNG